MLFKIQYIQLTILLWVTFQKYKFPDRKKSSVYLIIFLMLI